MSDTSLIPWVKALRFRAMHYLRYERQCLIVSCERPANFGNHHPDVFAITKTRNFIEVEIKVSAADLRADKEKRRHKIDDQYSSPAHQFYYIIPPKLEAIAQAELDPKFGILCVGYACRDEKPETAEKAVKECMTWVLRKAPLRARPKATVRQCVRMAENVSGTCISMAREIALSKAKEREDCVKEEEST